jgi:hypothetical protein
VLLASKGSQRQAAEANGEEVDPSFGIPVGSQAHPALNSLPKADELSIATELACESGAGPGSPADIPYTAFD